MAVRVMTYPLHTDAEGKQCIDLDAAFGSRYRLGWEADGATRSQWPRADWPWLRRVLCRRGYVYVYGGDVLGAVTTRPLIGRRLRRLPGVLRAFGDVETVIHFPAGMSAAVFALLQPYRRRQVSAETLERLRRVGFGGERHTESASTPPESTIVSPDVSTYLPADDRAFPAPAAHGKA